MSHQDARHEAAPLGRLARSVKSMSAADLLGAVKWVPSVCGRTKVLHRDKPRKLKPYANSFAVQAVKSQLFKLSKGFKTEQFVCFGCLQHLRLGDVLC